MDSSIYYGSGAINGRDDIRPAPRRSREPLAKLGVEWEGDWEAKNKTDERCLDMGLSCAKLLSSNEPNTEPTPYAAYTTPYRHAIRSYFAAGAISAVAILRGSAERADAVAGLSGFSGSFGAPVIGPARRQG